MEQILEQLANQGIVPIPVKDLARKSDYQMSFSYFSDKRTEIAPNIFRNNDLFLFPLYGGEDYNQGRCIINIGNDVKKYLLKNFNDKIKPCQDMEEANTVIQNYDCLLDRMSKTRGIWWTENPKNLESSEYMEDMARKLINVFSPYMFDEIKNGSEINLVPVFGDHVGHEVSVIYGMNNS